VAVVTTAIVTAVVIAAIPALGHTATGNKQAFQLPFALAVAHTYASAGAVQLLCPGFASPMNAWNIRIVAMKAGTLRQFSL
jgi:hypothetical protein